MRGIKRFFDSIMIPSVVVCTMIFTYQNHDSIHWIVRCLNSINMAMEMMDKGDRPEFMKGGLR